MPALPYQRFEPTPRARMLTPEVMEVFRYDAQQNCFICPQGHRLKFSGNA